MNRMAIFVEGYTEVVFVDKLIREIVEQNSVLIQWRRLHGGMCERCPHDTPMRQRGWLSPSLTHRATGGCQRAIWDAGAVAVSDSGWWIRLPFTSSVK